MTEIVQVTSESTVIVQDTDTNVVEVTAAGPAGGQGPAGPGFATGGTLGQVLAKASAADYDTEWTTISGTGTVTSVAATVPVGFVVSGSPITTSGTIAIGFAVGYSLPSDAEQSNWDTAYSWGNHALAGYALAGANTDITSLTGLTGAIATADSVQFDTGITPVVGIGKLQWDTTYGTLQVGLAGGNVNLQIGQEINQYCLNNTGVTISDFRAVYITGASGNRPTIALAIANSEATSAVIIGITTEDIANNQRGYVTTDGMIHNVDTSALTEGAPIWLSATVPGGMTSTKPIAPNHLVLLGYCIRQHASAGQIYVKVHNGYEIDELHDVKVTGTPVAGSLLIRNATLGIWENATVSSGTGISITNADKSITVTNTAPDQVVSLTAGANVTVTGTYPNFTIAASGGGGSGTVTSVALSAPVGFAVTGSPITASGTLALAFAAGYSLPTDASQTNWDTAYSERRQWDGGSTNLVAATGRTSLGATTLGGNLFTITNPSAVTFPRFNADNTVSALDAATFRTAIGAGVGSVTSVGITPGTGISVSGSPITGSGSITVTNTAPMTYPGAGVAVSTGSAWGTSLTAPSGAIVGTTDTQTLTNKRVTQRVSTTTSSATPTINTDNVDVYGLTAQAVDITSFTTNLTGTPVDGQKLWIYIVGTAARAITWGASFEASTIALPTTTVSTNRLDVGFIWNAATSKWRCVGTV